ncbi:IucA/IucC family protein [Bacillus sp. KH172YL63]|uniref:IucA/IucC family protein n=1 Tax=Bacillus sp. KH172YL63 TaxID=2709784 RepID=UPI0013E4DFDE|nr:IucA/IucC family protein [Bacillus sp. KH172YL63]BCB03732.1 D-ornithine--citrate ligase SfnaD [Bacillus sp. KH172YL63]
MNTVENPDLLLIQDHNVQASLEELLPRSEKRILHKLIQAILREKIVPYSWMQNESGKIFYINTSHDRTVSIPVKHTYILGHIDIDGPITIQTENGRSVIETPKDLVNELFRGKAANAGVKQLSEELDNSVRNDALALTAGEQRKSHFGNDTLTYLQEAQTSDPSFSPLVFLEQMVIEGHTLHPCSKTRIGLSATEVISYAPEWRKEVNLIPLAIHKSISRMTYMNDGKTMAEILFQEHSGLKEAVRESVMKLGKAFGEYEVIPVHPWQYEHTITSHFQEEIKSGLLIPVPLDLPYHPLISFRSLAPGSRMKHHVKTALNVQMTSAKRIVSPTSVWNGPVLSELLQTISNHDGAIKETITFLSERCGGHYHAQRSDDSLPLSKNLSALIRENPEADLAENEIAVPGAALINTSPVSGEILVSEIIQIWAKAKDVTTEIAGVDFIQDYARTLIPGLLHLIVKYGISMEAHLQNALVRFENGVPKKLLVRDNGGIRIMAERLRPYIEPGRISNDTNLLTEDPVDLYKMFSHAVLHNHLGEMIVSIAKELGIEENLMWKKVSVVIEDTLEELKAEEAHRDAAIHVEEALFGPHTYLKSLIKMRLSDAFTDNAYVFAPNPLIHSGKENSIVTL